MRVCSIYCWLMALLLRAPQFSQGATNDYAVFLADEPLAAHFSSRAEMQSAARLAWRGGI
jgi:hypothetical protein